MISDCTFSFNFIVQNMIVGRIFSRGEKTVQGADFSNGSQNDIFK